MTPNAIFCEIMQKARIKQRLSTVELAAQSGLKSSDIDSWERHKRAPRVGTAMKWARALGYDLRLEKIKRHV